MLLVVSTPKSAVKRDVSKSSYNSSSIFLPVTKTPIPKAKFSLVLFNLSKKDTFSFLGSLSLLLSSSVFTLSLTSTNLSSLLLLDRESSTILVSLDSLLFLESDVVAP